jgi:hypothetical protein
MGCIIIVFVIVAYELLVQSTMVIRVVVIKVRTRVQIFLGGFLYI